MADTPKTNPPAEDDMHWGIAYLREDIQDLRLGQRAGHDRMDAMGKDLTARMDALSKDLTARMDVGNKALSDRIDAGNARTDSRFALLLTAMIALIGISIGANFTFLQLYLPSQ